MHDINDTPTIFRKTLRRNVFQEKKTKQKVKESNPSAILCFLFSFCVAWQKQQNEGDSQIRSPVLPIPRALWCEFLFC